VHHQNSLFYIGLLVAVAFKNYNSTSEVHKKLKKNGRQKYTLCLQKTTICVWDSRRRQTAV